MDDLATLVNRALTEQGADMLVTASVEKNYDAGQQRLIFKSNTGEHISVTDWPDTDYLPMPQSIAGLEMERDSSNNNAIVLPDWNHTMLIGDKDVDFSALTANMSFTVAAGVQTKTIDLSLPPPSNMNELLTLLNG